MSIDTNKLIRQLGYADRVDLDFGEVAQFAASLNDRSEEEIEEALKERFPIGVRVMYGNNDDKPFEVFGQALIDGQTFDQMDAVMASPVVTAGALLPDAHLGYGMPIGGVALLNNAVSPGYVGYDIACRMMMSVIDDDHREIMQAVPHLLRDMQEVTRFGVGSHFDKGERREHPIMEEFIWGEYDHLQSLQKKAWDQLGTSGGGNHFMDLMVGEVVADRDWMPFEKGDRFTAIVTHSGSRGAGHTLARHYMDLAKKHTKTIAYGVPDKHAWLSLTTEAGQEYWRIMQLMGGYAQANHQLIHDHFYRTSGLSERIRWENHHNFAWVYDGIEAPTANPIGKTIVHRKGATPALEGQVGIIPGSAGDLSFLVEGKGNIRSLVSSSHGAGRNMSRTQAKNEFTRESLNSELGSKGVAFRGVGLDESPGAYKKIEEVMRYQEGVLVDVIAEMYPIAVVMAS